MTRTHHERTGAARDAVAIALLLALAAPLLLVNLGNHYLWQDEAQTAVISRTILDHGIPLGFDGRNLFSQELGIEYGDDYVWKWHAWLSFYVCAASLALFGSTTLAALGASQATGYGVPDIGDVGLTVVISLAATKWSRLTDDQLLAWASIWSAVRADDDRPFVGYEITDADESRSRLNLFDQSPRDGFCVAWALALGDGEVPVRVRSFLDGLAGE